MLIYVLIGTKLISRSKGPVTQAQTQGLHMVREQIPTHMIYVFR